MYFNGYLANNHIADTQVPITDTQVPNIDLPIPIADTNISVLAKYIGEAKIEQVLTGTETGMI